MSHWPSSATTTRWAKHGDTVKKSRAILMSLTDFPRATSSTGTVRPQWQQAQAVDLFSDRRRPNTAGNETPLSKLAVAKEPIYAARVSFLSENLTKIECGEMRRAPKERERASVRGQLNSRSLMSRNS